MNLKTIVNYYLHPRLINHIKHFSLNKTIKIIPSKSLNTFFFNMFAQVERKGREEFKLGTFVS